MIIFGSRGVTGVKQKGTFFCPNCGEGSRYMQKRVRRFFTLYFIPIIPLDKLGEYVECVGCKGTYDESVLDYDPAETERQAEALYVVAMKQTMIGILLADGVVDEDEVRAVQEICQDLGGLPISEADVRAEIAAMQQERASPLELVARVAGNLNDSGKENVVRAAYRIAASDGFVSDSELELMAEIGKALELSAAHYRGIMADLADVTGG